MNPKRPSEGLQTRDTEYSAQISETGLSVLRSMIGNRFYSILAPCLQVAGSHLTAPSFSIPVFDRITGNWSRQYIVIQCDWSETPLTLTDYWQMLVCCDDKPDRIGVDSTGAIIAPCTIKYFRATPICKIDVYEFECSPEFDQGRETVKYDKGIRFESVLRLATTPKTALNDGLLVRVRLAWTADEIVAVLGARRTPADLREQRILA